MSNIEKDWTTKAGLRAVVLMTDMGHRCGYVGVTAAHPLHGASYSAPHAALAPVADDEPIGKRGVIPILCAGMGGSEWNTPELVFNVHGGLTYSGGSATYPVLSDGLWWFGYDCGHAGDAASPEYYEQQREKYPEHPILWGAFEPDARHRDLDYCTSECESLAEQLASVVVPA